MLPDMVVQAFLSRQPAALVTCALSKNKSEICSNLMLKMLGSIYVVEVQLVSPLGDF